METIMLIFIILAYCIILKLIEYAISKRMPNKENITSAFIRGKDECRFISAIKLTLKNSSDQFPPDSKETITMLFTDKDSFHDEWGIIEDDEEKPH